MEEVLVTGQLVTVQRADNSKSGLRKLYACSLGLLEAGRWDGTCAIALWL